jgi:predicted nucleotidyltransferase
MDIENLLRLLKENKVRFVIIGATVSRFMDMAGQHSTPIFLLSRPKSMRLVVLKPWQSLVMIYPI